MLLTLSTTHHPATDLGFLLYKNPARAQTVDLTFGQAHVFYSEATEQKATAALLVEVDPIALVRNNRGPAGDNRGGFALQQYVNDRPYAANSFLSVAIAETFGSALSGKSRERPELVSQPIPLEARIHVLPCRMGEDFLKALFEPLGYTLKITKHPLDERFPEWGESRYYDITLSATTPLQTLLRHLYVLIPVLDGDKHYWIGDEEVQKLLRHGEGWLAAHPLKEQIVDRYLKRRGHLTRQALAQLLDTDQTEVEEKEDANAAQEEVVEKPLRLNDERHHAVIEALKSSGATSVLDLGCSTGTLLRKLLTVKQFTKIVGLDVSHRCLEISADRLDFERMPPKQHERITLLHGSLTYRDARLAGFDAAAVVEVIEHLDEPRLAAFERVLFEFARPHTIVLTTPNIEHNVRFPTLAHGSFRHRDHRFEWTRDQFQTWAQKVAAKHTYSVTFHPVGNNDPEVGPPTQMAVFSLGEPVPT